MTSRIDLKGAYRRWVDGTKSGRDVGDAMKLAIGGEFEAFGLIQAEMLRFYGLSDGQTLIDVGCGSGRTAIPLSRSHRGGYLGTDLVPELIAHARAACPRPDWRFEVVDSLTIPAADSSADMVCFFSVLTHLLHEQSYLYLEEAKRVLRPGGRIVLSFLEFRMPFHWQAFGSTVEDARGANQHPLNVFIEREALRAWAEHLDLKVEAFRDGSEPFVPLPHPVTLDDGRVMSDKGNLGQSICVLSRPE